MKIRWQTQRAKALYALAIPVLLMVPLAVHSTYIMLLLDQVLIYIVCVLGLNYITGLTGQNNLGMGAIFGLGAYTSALLTVRLQVSAFVGLLGAIAMGFVIGQVLGRPSLRVKGIYLALTTISFGEIVRLLLTNMQGLTYGTLGVSNIPAYNFFGIVLDTEHKLYYLFLAVVILSIIICNRIVHSRWGREFRAIRDNDESIPSLGINITRVKIIAFTLCAVFGCIAGALYAHLIRYIHPTDFKMDLSIKFLMMLMLGGIGSVPGIILGAFIVTILPEALRFMSDYYMLVFSLILLLFAVFRPYGLISFFGKGALSLDRLRALREKWAPKGGKAK